MRVNEQTVEREAIAAARGPARSVAAAILGGTLLLALAGCSVVPDWSPSDAEDVLVTVDYGPGRRLVEIPTSGRELVIRNLFTNPAPPVEAFEDGVRMLQIPDEGLRLECRLRFYGRGSSAPAPESLFPGARSVSTWGRGRPSTAVAPRLLRGDDR